MGRHYMHQIPRSTEIEHLRASYSVFSGLFSSLPPLFFCLSRRSPKRIQKFRMEAWAGRAVRAHGSLQDAVASRALKTVWVAEAWPVHEVIQ